MGKAARKPLTQDRLARMLKPLAITTKNIRVGNKVSKGYVRAWFEEAFARYLPRKEASEPPGRYNADGPFQPATANPDVRGLSSRRVRELADWYSDLAYWHYSKNALDAGALDAELRAILRKEVAPEHVEIEFGRVMKVVPWACPWRSRY
jgi:hypothetical protein